MQTSKFSGYDILINATDFEKSANEEEFESNVIEACMKTNSVQRYIPADFTLDYRKFAEGENEKMDIRKNIASLLEKNKEKLSYTSILNGVFMERLFDPFYQWKILNLEKKKVEFYSDDDKEPIIDFSFVFDLLVKHDKPFIQCFICHADLPLRLVFAGGGRFIGSREPYACGACSVCHIAG